MPPLTEPQARPPFNVPPSRADLTVLERVMELLASIIQRPVSDVLANSDFDALGVDSIDHVELLISLEHEYKFSANGQSYDRLWENICTPQQAVEFLRTYFPNAIPSKL